MAGTTAAGRAPEANPGSIPNHAVDVVVPTAGGISLALSGGTCVLTDPATSWAAAEVGGIAALLVQRYPADSPQQIAARLTATASGTTGEAGKSPTSRYFGAGVVQPVDALTRPLTSDGHAFGGELRAARADATGPPARLDVGHPPRHPPARDLGRPRRRGRDRRRIDPPAGADPAYAAGRVSARATLVELMGTDGPGVGTGFITLSR